MVKSLIYIISILYIIPILLLGLVHSFIDNYVVVLFSTSLTLFLVLVPIVANLIKNNNFNELKEELLYILKHTINFSILIFFLNLLYNTINGNNIASPDQIYEIAEFVFKNSLMVFIIMNANVFGICSKYVNSKIHKLIYSINSFFTEKFLFNILFLVLLLEFKINSGIFMALLGSYIFFVLTDVNNIYKDKKKDKLKLKLTSFEKDNIVISVVMNIILILLIGDLFNYISGELLISSFFTDGLYLKLIYFIVIIIFSNIYEYISLKIEKIINKIKRKRKIKERH